MMGDVVWIRSSFCGNGDCVEVARSSDGHVLVRDSKLGNNSPVLSFTSGAWARVLEDINDGNLPDGAGWLTDGGTYWGRLEFTADEWFAFVEDLDKFDYDKLSSSGEVGSVGSGSNQAATGAGEEVEGPSVDPVPVAAQLLDLGAIRWRAEEATHGPWRVVEEHGRDISDEGWSRIAIQSEAGNRPEVAEIIGDDVSYGAEEWAANAEFIAHAREDIPRLLGLIDNLCDEIDRLHNEQEKDAITIASMRAAIDEADAEPAWGSGPLVVHNPDGGVR